MKIISVVNLFFFILFVFSGCSFNQKPEVQTINRSNLIQNHQIKKQKEKSAYHDSSKLERVYKNSYEKSVNSGSIKGVIVNLSYNRLKKSWLYEIKGKDISNGKLPYARFYHYKKLANIGDFVYVILQNSKLVDLYFIKKANKKVVEKIKKKRVKKRNKVVETIKGGKILKIKAPVEESIVF